MIKITTPVLLNLIEENIYDVKTLSNSLIAFTLEFYIFNYIIGTQLLFIIWHQITLKFAFLFENVNTLLPIYTQYCYGRHFITLPK